LLAVPFTADDASDFGYCQTFPCQHGAYRLSWSSGGGHHDAEAAVESLEHLALGDIRRSCRRRVSPAPVHGPGGSIDWKGALPAAVSTPAAGQDVAEP
jgi:hypothetical protein